MGTSFAQLVGYARLRVLSTAQYWFNSGKRPDMTQNVDGGVMPQSKQIKQTLKIGKGTDPTSEQVILASAEVMLLRIETRLKLCMSRFLVFRHSGPIVTKFYLKHHWGGVLIALGFGPGWIGTLVSMATNSSHKVIMGKML